MRGLLPTHIEVPFTVLISGTLFFALFLAIVFLVYSKRRRGAYQATSMLPLEDENFLSRSDNSQSGAK